MTVEDLLWTYIRNSYNYYILYDDCDISDHEYDLLCKILLERYEEFPLKYKERISKESLQAGTGFDLTIADYQALGHKL